MHPSNWTETGGTVGRTRTLPTFEIVQLPNGCFGLLDETQDRRGCAWGFASPTQLIEAFRVKAQGRVTGLYRTELTPAGEQLCIPGTERQPVAGKPAQLSLFGG
jgi:hypothetical protein